MNRRQFARLMAASLALAGATTTGCRRWPEQQVRPQVSEKEGFLPGVAEYFATQFELGGVSTGVLAKSLDGRPIKIEGNELHPFSLGAAGIHAQASVLGLYDPQRSRRCRYRAADGSRAISVDRSKFEEAVGPHFANLKTLEGAGLYFLLPSSSSPTLTALRQELRQAFPRASWHRFDSIDRDNEFAGAQLAFGQAARCQFQLDKAKLVVCLEADLLNGHPGHQRWCRDWAASRNLEDSYSRLLAVESSYSVTGAAADQRWPLSPQSIEQLAEILAANLNLMDPPVSVDEKVTAIADRILSQLKNSAQRSLLIAGPSLSPQVHALVHLINDHLGTVGTTLAYTAEPLATEQSSVDSMAGLCSALRAGVVRSLVIIGGNPAYDAPVDLEFARALSLASDDLNSIHLSLYDDETSQLCRWHVPAAHDLEAWGDGRAWDGTYGIQQPLILPLYDGWSAIQLLSWIDGRGVVDGHDRVRQTAAEEFGIEDDNQWQQQLHDGVLAGSQYDELKTPRPAAPSPHNQSPAKGLSVRFVTDSRIYDGRFANNGWLQELPDPITKLTWGNAALINESDARQHGLRDGDEIRITLESGSALERIPVLMVPGQAKGCIALPIGYGRRHGHIAEDVGVNVNVLRNSRARFVAGNAVIHSTGHRDELAITQEPETIDGIGAAGRQYRIGGAGKPGALVRETTLNEYQHNPEALHEKFHVPSPAPMFDQPSSFRTPHAWGMAIDLNRCIGCSACTIACQAENNIPVVGKANVIQHREMHWIRVDRYFKGSTESPDVVHVPVACVHCEDAPCEQVCPVAATVHDTEGLNAMVYNRCVGTRYCANNCPYKVRRFNYFDYHASDPTAPARPWLNLPDRQTALETSRLQQLVFNPDVSVRMRGVMEKCTYCVQRISQAKRNARLEHVRGERSSSILADGEVVTACQQACPTQAISFGDLNVEQSQVAAAHRDERAYEMLAELNIKPRTRYLARIRNRDTESSASDDEHSSHGEVKDGHS